MKYRFLLLLVICLLLSTLSAVTIYDIQYTTNAGGGTYPSLYAGQYVTTQGIVTSTGYSSNRGFHISMPEGGAWKGLLIYTNTTDFHPDIGSLVEVTGQVYEYNGLTEIQYISDYNIISTGNPVPAPTIVTTAQFNNEAYEGVLVQVQNAQVTQAVDGNGEWDVTDGSGECIIKSYFFSQSNLGSQVTIGNIFTGITGIGHYSYGYYSLNPRTTDDVVPGSQAVAITLPNLQANVSDQFIVPVVVSELTAAQDYQTYQFQLGFNPAVLSYVNYNKTGTLSSAGTVNVTPTSGNLSVTFSTTGTILGQGTLLNLTFSATAAGSSTLTASNFSFDSVPVTLVTQGSVDVYGTSTEVLDTLTVIQRPLINIPAIVLPGETFKIECVAPQTTTDWTAQLYKGNLSADVPITNAQYETTPPRWILTATVPDVNVFELYDLRVTASCGINDRTRHSVQVLPTRKTNYYFAQVTDVHMPTHIFSPNTGYDTDSTETVDFREVIKDINVIRPEFVLITGDLVNEGELEDYQNLRVYTKAKRVLGEFEVPVFLIAGNHDISGWQPTPPPAGSSRKFWWKNFGWSWLDNLSASWTYHTQDFSFDYGSVHYIGMEGYNNTGSYDNYLPEVYGSDSYTAGQMQWLQADLAASDAPVNVLFQHYDFSDQINLNTLGLNMSLGGHTHTNSGSITSQPYELLTDNVCDGARAYRIVKVNGTTLQPLSTINAGSAGNQITLTFTPNNYVTVDSVSAYLVNNQPISFENAVVKFNMPSGNAGYTVTGGVLEQVDISGDHNVCYVKVNLGASSTATVTIKANNNIIPLSPAQCSVTSAGATRILNWNAVTHDINGFPITVSSYIIEASTEPFSGFVSIGSTANTQYIDTESGYNKRFYRIIAEIETP